MTLTVLLRIRHARLVRPYLLARMAAGLVAGLIACSPPPPEPLPTTSSPDSPKSPPATTASLIQFRPVAVDGPWASVDTDYMYSCATRPSGELWCWGMNSSGKLGDGTSLHRNAPVPVAGPPQWISYSMADHLTCGVTPDHNLWCWGSQIGARPADNGSGRPTNLTPERVPVIPQGPFGLTAAQTPEVPLTAVGLGDAHACVLTTSGQVLCLGDDHKAGSKGPITGAQGWRPIDTSQLPGISTFSMISVGSKHTCALTPEAEALCWGENPRGQVGSGTFSPSAPIPTRPDLSDLQNRPVLHLAAGTFHTCAIVVDSILACWGGNDSGCLGTGDALDRAKPTPMQLPESMRRLRWAAVDGGFHSTCALTSEGDIYCWGELACSQQTAPGHNTPCGPTPVAGPSISGSVPFRQIVVGCNHACALGDDRQIYCWGQNRFGELGWGGSSVDNPSDMGPSSRGSTGQHPDRAAKDQHRSERPNVPDAVPKGATP